MTHDNGKPTATFTLHYDAWGRLVLVDAQGKEHVGVAPVRAFPITDPEHWIGICDSSGREVACVEDPATLSPEVRKALDADLASREFVPVIRRIVSVSGNTLPCEWDVETDRGRTQFVFKDEEDIRRLGPFRALVFDAQAIRYLIDDTRQLDGYSRRILDRYM